MDKIKNFKIPDLKPKENPSKPLTSPHPANLTQNQTHENYNKVQKKTAKKRVKFAEMVEEMIR